MDPDHPDVLKVQETLAGIYREMGRTDEAVEIQMTVLSQRQKRFGHFHAQVASSHYNLGITYEHKQDLRRALQSFAQAHLICRQKLGAGHPWTRTHQMKILELQRRLREPPDSVASQ